MPTFKELLAEAKRQIREVEPRALAARLWGAEALSRPPPTVVDVREAEEVAGGRIAGALAIPRGLLELRIEEQVPDKGAPLVVYCAGGTRSALAAQSLVALGYAQVESLAGGYGRWTDQGLPVAAPPGLSAAQKERYQRHLTLPEVGEAGQQKLLAAKVLLVGAGGLGSSAALYLAAAGVGTLGLVDGDAVSLSNLQRQILHGEPSLGQPKTASAAARLRTLNSEVELLPFAERLTAGNAERILAPFDLVVDGSDNFPTRYLLNDACVWLNKPSVHGSVFRFEGQVTTFVPREGPCYRCLFPQPPPANLAPSCAEAGVLGAVPGLIGVLQAIEALKLILGTGQPLLGRLLTYEALATRFVELRFQRDPQCPVCAQGVTFPGLVDYAELCAPEQVSHCPAGN